MKNRKMKIAAFLLTSVLAVVPCSGVTASVSEQTEGQGAYVGMCFDGGELYENELIEKISNEDGDVTIRMMQYGLSIPASALDYARDQGKKLIIEIFQPGNDAAMFNSRWVYDPSTVYWIPDIESYPLGVSVSPDQPYHSSHPEAASNPINSVLRGGTEEQPLEWAVYSLPTAEGEDGQAGYSIPGFYVEIAHWGEFDGMGEMPLYSYDEEKGSLFNRGYAVRGDDGIVSDSIVWHTVRINHPVWGENYAVLSDEHNFLPVEEIEEQIEDDSVSAVEIQMGACYLDNQYVVPAEVLDKLSDSGKTLSLTSPGVESQPTYSWHFDGTKITDTTDVDLHIQFYYSGETGMSGVAVPQECPAILLDFAHSGLVPGGTSIRMTAPEDMRNGYLYYVNEEKGMFEYIGRTSWEKENEYFGTLTISGITHCSYYLVTGQELTGDNVVIPDDSTVPSEPENPGTSEIPGEAEKPDNTGQSGGTEQPGNQSHTDENANTAGVVETGDSVPVLPAAAAVLSLGVAVIVLKKKALG